ncbi:MAG: ABC transporter permease [Thermoplasmata archaeon]
MSLGSFSRYAVQSVFRNRRRTLAAIIGVLLAITLVAGENIAIDSTASSVLKQMMDSVAYDFEGTSYTNREFINASNALSAVTNVEAVEPIVELGQVQICEWGYNGSENISFADVKAISSTFHAVADRFGFQSDPSVPSGQIVITEDLAEWLEVGPGDQLTLRYTIYAGPEPAHYFLNFTVAKVAYMKEEEETFVIRPSFIFANTILVNLADLETIISDFGLEDSEHLSLSSFYFIWVDRDAVVRPGDPSKTDELLHRMQRELNNAGSDYSITVHESSLGYIIQVFNMWLTIYRAIFLALALPAIVLGLYLGIIGAELGLSERRREIGILKARGATDRQVFGLLIIEAIILGVIAGVLGIFFGALTSNLFSVLVPYGKAPSVLEMTITEFTVVFAIILAVLLLMFSTYRPAKRVSALPVAESLQKYSKEEAAVQYKPTRDLIFIGLAAFTYSSLLLLRHTEPGGSPVWIALCFIGLFVMVLTPFAPFFLIIGLTSFLTRISTRIYDWTSRITKVFTKDLYDIVNKNIVRNPKRASNVCVLIAMGLGFGIIVSTMGETQEAYLERSLVAEIGGDLIFHAWSVNHSFAEDVREVQGVSQVTECTNVKARFGISNPDLWVINHTSYWQVVHPDSYFFKEGDPRTVISSLGGYGNVIINENLASSEYLRVNDRITVEVENWYFDPEGNMHHSPPIDYEFTVIGIVKILPGFGTAGAGIFDGGSIFVDFSTLNETTFGNQSFNFIVDVSAGENPSAVGDRIEESFRKYIAELRVYEEELKKAKSDPFTGALFNFLLIEFAFALLIIGIGLGLIMFVAATEREGEFASIMSRGASSKQVAGLLLGEAVTIIVIGVVIGIATGLLTAYVFNELIGFGVQGGAPGALERPLVVSYQTLALISATIVVLIVASLLASLKIRRMKLAQALRKRGG